MHLPISRNSKNMTESHYTPFTGHDASTSASEPKLLVKGFVQERNARVYLLDRCARSALSDVHKPGLYRDPESLEDVPLMPGISQTDNMLRWGFIKKVYGIISTQLLLTTAVALVIYLVQPVQNFVLSSPGFQIAAAILPLVGLIPLYYYQTRHPWNLVILGVWTLLLSVGVGTACTAFAPHVIVEALALTAAIVVGLTAYAFHASKKGKDFTFLGPILFSSLLALVMWGFIQIFFPVGGVGETIFALLGALIFSGYLVFDTANLIQNYDLDQYIWASVNLYLDILNLFLKILQLLGRNGR